MATTIGRSKAEKKNVEHGASPQASRDRGRCYDAITSSQLNPGPPGKDGRRCFGPRGIWVVFLETPVDFWRPAQVVANTLTRHSVLQVEMRTQSCTPPACGITGISYAAASAAIRRSSVNPPHQ